jgi:hypothetical protein
MYNNFQVRIIAILRGSPNGLTSNEIAELSRSHSKEHELAFKQAGYLWDHRQSPPQLWPKGERLPRTTL